ncbi:A/G-specific adenine glycosylase [Oceanicella actignis]|uniref:Adenine DNA glycosylase n=1 Tax=Oceanicella actignis TaxID=1189325 RepID=A0A1M7TRR9_9RHOB|nr:A/G-specific adenine glycosylase [Oceanicella actignis]SET77870.1 A/G-specific DNA-adenine glycosylase [Oceanicella actignis]SHN73368.1 A/G-specific DNA-adenine glycosylase [Oceanicella actignis]
MAEAPQEPRPDAPCPDAPRPDPAALLAWYDRAARRLPWRTPPGAAARPDPYAVWLSEIMLQQTTVAAVIPYFQTFIRRWPTVAELAAAPEDQVMAAWAGLGYYARARNMLRCARIVAAAGGRFPADEAALRALPGIGPYTAAAIAAIAFDIPATVVDGNVERVMARLFAATDPLPAAKPRLRALAAGLTPARRPGDYAQAVMDLGATVCTPRKPDCPACPWREDCAARRLGLAAELPRKAPRRARPHRRGVVFVGLREDGALLLETRPPEGLLGGMTGLPGGAWREAAEPLDDPAPPCPGDWRRLTAEARHVFTHFALTLEIRAARLGPEAAPEGGAFFAPDARARAAELPTVFRKAVELALPELEAAGPGR